MAYKEFGATIAPANVSSTGFPIAIGTHIGGGRIVNDKTTLNSKHWCLLGEGTTLNDQKANAIGQIWYDTLDNKYWKLDSWTSTDPVWVDVSTIFATKSYVDTEIENIPDPMIFKGSLGTEGTITSLPTASTSNTGFTYKVITAGTYAGQVAKVGDTFISDGTIWNLIPSGDDAGGTVTSITLNATSPILIDDSNAITTSGTRTFSHASTSGNKHIPSGGSADNYLKWDSDGTATWSALPTASTSVAGITTVGASGGAASYVHTHVKSDITDFDHNHDTLYAKVGNSFYYVVGNTTGTAGTWTGTISEVTSLYSGLTIAYKIGITGASTTTLNINSLGANTVLRNTGNLTTHLPVGTVVVLTFDGTYWRWADYADGDTFDRTYWNNTITAGATIYDYKLLAQGLDGKFYPLTLEEGTGTTKTISTQEFEINTQILYYNSTTNIIANSTTSNVYSEIAITTLSYTANQTSWTSQLPIYLVGIVQPNGNIKLDNSSYTSFMTQTLPTTANGKVYIMLGYMYSTTGMRLFQYHPMYEYRDGALRVYMPVHSHGNITDGGAIGTTSGLMVKTTTSGVLTTLSAGTSGQFLQYDGTWATPTGTYSLPLASNGTRGGIQIGYTEIDANIPLKLDSEKGYVTLTTSSITSALEYTPYDSTNPNNYTSNTGTVTSIATGTGLTGGPITTTGTIDLATAYGDTVNPYASKTAKYVLAAPNASDGVPSFRELVASDIVTSSITFNDGGTGDTSETTYNGSTARTISYNTIGAAASNHTHTYKIFDDLNGVFDANNIFENVSYYVLNSTNNLNRASLPNALYGDGNVNNSIISPFWFDSSIIKDNAENNQIKQRIVTSGSSVTGSVDNGSNVISKCYIRVTRELGVWTPWQRVLTSFDEYNEQPDWNQTNPYQRNYIKNKPDIIAINNEVYNSASLNNITTTGVYPLIYGREYFETPNPACGTISVRSDLEGFLMVYSKEENISQQIHDTINNIFYIRSFDSQSNNWNYWEKIITCKASYGEQGNSPEVTREGFYLDEQEIPVNTFYNIDTSQDSKDLTIYIPLDNVDTYLKNNGPGGGEFKLTLMFSSPIANPNLVFSISSSSSVISTTYTINGTDPSGHSNISGLEIIIRWYEIIGGFLFSVYKVNIL